MIYGYLRVSTDNQDTENQKLGVSNWLNYKGWTCDEWVIEEGVSGKKDYKARLLGKLIDKLQEGDWLVVSELSRLSRSMINTFELVKELSKKGVSVFCVKENIQISDDALGLMILSSFAFAAQVERERIRQRTTEALKRAKSNGKKLGRPFGKAHKLMMLENTREYILKLVEDNVSGLQIAKKLGVSYRTLKTFFDKNGIITQKMKGYAETHKNPLPIRQKRNTIIYLQ